MQKHQILQLGLFTCIILMITSCCFIYSYGWMPIFSIFNIMPIFYIAPVWCVLALVCLGLQIHTKKPRKITILQLSTAIMTISSLMCFSMIYTSTIYDPGYLYFPNDPSYLRMYMFAMGSLICTGLTVLFFGLSLIFKPKNKQQKTLNNYVT